MNKQRELARRRQRRRFSVRNKSRSGSNRPRLSIHRSLQHIGCQIIDDEQAKTLVAVSTQDSDVREQFSYGGNCSAATTIGKLLAERAMAAGIKQVRFDRAHYKYHGRVAALADAAREGGLEF